MTATARIRQADLARTLRAVKDAGLEDGRVDIEPSGRIVIKWGRLAEKDERNPWDDEP